MKTFQLKTLVSIVSLMMTFTLQAADRYWVGGTDSLWNKTANWSTTSGGSGGASVPSTNDTVYFDANSSRNCYLNVATTLQYIHLQSGFTRSLFQQSNNITVNRKGLRVDAGTFEGGNGAITINAGGITLNGGTLNATSGTLTLLGNFANNGGNFNHNNGTITLWNANTISGNALSVHHLQVRWGTYNINTAVTVMGTFTYINFGNDIAVLNSSGSGKLLIQGNIVLNNNRNGGGGSTVMEINGSGNQTINSTVTMFFCVLPHIKIDKPSGTLKLKGEVTVAGTWDYVSGTLETDSATLNFYSNIIKGNTHSISNLRLGFNSVNVQTALTISKRLIYHNNGNNPVGISVSNGGTVAVQGDVLLQNTRGGGSGNATLLFNGTGNQNITSTIGMFACELPHVRIEKPSGVLKFKGEVSFTGTWDYVSGTLETDSATLNFYSNIIKGNAHSISNLRLGFNNVNVQTALTITKQLIYHHNNNNPVGISVSNGGTVAVQGDVLLQNNRGGDSGNATLLFNGTGNQNITSMVVMFLNELPHVKIEKPSGTLKLKGQVSVAGTWDYVSGTLETDSATINFMNNNIIRGTAHTLANVRIRMNYLNVQTALNISKNLIYHNMGSNPNGISVSNGGTVAVQGNIYLQNTRAGWPGNATLTLNGTGTQLISSTVGIGASSLPAMVINKASGILQLQGIINLSNSWTHTQGNVDANTFNSTVILSNQNNTINGKAVFDNLRIQSSDNLGIAINDTITVKDSLLLVGTNINILNGKMLQAEGHLINSNTAYNGGGTATIQLTGSNNQTIAGLDSATVNAEGRGRLPRLTVNKSGGMLTWRGVINVHGKLTWQQGFSEAPTYSKVVLFETDSLLGNTVAASLTPTTGNMAFYELKYMNNNTRKLQAPLTINRRLILGGSLLKLNSQALNINTKDSTAIEATARLLADDTTGNSQVVWQVGNSTRTYTVPFVNSSLQPVSLQADITQAGIGSNGSLTFSTYTTNTQNKPYPESNDNSFGFIDSNQLKIADRYWLLQHSNFDSLPTLTVRTQYATQDIASPNTINEDSLNLSTFTLPCWAKKTGTLNKTQKHYTAANLKQTLIALALHDKSAVVVCNDGRSCANAYKLPDIYNDETVYLVNDTVKWLKFKALRTKETFLLFENPVTANNYVKRIIVLSGNCNVNDTILDVTRGANDTSANLVVDSLTIGYTYLVKIISNSNVAYSFSGPRICQQIATITFFDIGGDSLIIYGSDDGDGVQSAPEVNGIACGTEIVFGESDECNDGHVNNADNNETFMCFEIFNVNTDNIVNNEFEVLQQVKDTCLDIGTDLRINNLPPGCYGYRFDYFYNFGVSVRRSDFVYFCILPDNRNFDISFNPYPVCLGDQITATCVGCTANDFVFRWIVNGQIIGNNQDLKSINFTLPNAGTYDVTMITDDLCGGDTVTRQVTVNNPTPNFEDSVLCSNNNQVQVIFTDASVCARTWSWNFGAGASPATATGQGPHTVTYSTSGTKVVRLTIDGGLFINRNIIVNIQPNPVINNPLLRACKLSNNPFNVSNVQANTVYNWVVTNGTANPATGTSTTINWLSRNGGFIRVDAINTVTNCTTRTTIEVLPCCFGEGFIDDSTVVDINNRGLALRDGDGDVVILGDLKLIDGVNGLASLLNLQPSPLPNYLLLQPGVSGFPNNFNKLTVHGNLTINGNLHINNLRDINFGPFASITILANDTLFINNSLLHEACDTMWNGIKVNGRGALIMFQSELRDAIIGVDVALLFQTPGMAFLTNNEFNMNKRHLRFTSCLSPACKDNMNSAVTSNTFTCTNTLFFPYLNTRTSVGIQVNSSKKILIGGGAGNTFQQADTAMYFRNTTALVYGNTINSMNFLNNSGYGILAINTLPSSNPAIGIPDIKVAYNNMNNVRFGIATIGYENIDIDTNTIVSQVNSNSAAIMIFNQKSRAVKVTPTIWVGLPIINVRKNTITRGSVGVWSFGNPGIQNIEHNNINFTGTLANVRRDGVVVSTATSPFSQQRLVSIDSNEINNVHDGIVVLNRPSHIIDNNSITLTSSGNYAARGIYSINAPNSLIRYNTILGDNNISNLQTGINLFVHGSNARVVCNDIEEVYTSMLSNGNSMYTYIYNNEFKDARRGFHMASGEVGIQGNPFTGETSDNTWISSNPTILPFQPNLLTIGTQLPKATFFLVRANAPSVYFPTTTLGNPNPIQRYVESNPKPISQAICQSNTASAIAAFANITHALKVAQDSMVYFYDSVHHHWWNKYQLYYTLSISDSMRNAYTALADFYDAYEANNMMVALDSLADDIEIFDIDDEQHGQTYNVLKNKLKALNPAALQESYAKQYALALLEVKNGNDSTYLLDKMWQIANTCVLYGGPSVMLARAQLAMMLDSIDLAFAPWENSCIVPQERRGRFRNEQTANTSPQHDYRIHPNLLLGNSVVTITLPEKEQGKVYIYNSWGSKITHFDVQEGKNTIDLANFIGKGMYLYQVYINDELKTRDKLLIH